jgi:cytochrome c oxidase cbb3-type subunit 4|tara:strand:+ start:291 stop:503 length:213 start_codon:yes stop_codon:yes gene_type:complete
MNIGILQGIGTILAMAAFIGVCVWAWSSKNKQRFDEAAQLPFMDDDLGTDNSENNNSQDSQEDQGRQNHE